MFFRSGFLKVEAHTQNQVLAEFIAEFTWTYHILSTNTAQYGIVCKVPSDPRSPNWTLHTSSPQRARSSHHHGWWSLCSGQTDTNSCSHLCNLAEAIWQRPSGSHLHPFLCFCLAYWFQKQSLSDYRMLLILDHFDFTPLLQNIASILPLHKGRNCRSVNLGIPRLRNCVPAAATRCHEHMDQHPALKT